MGGNVYTEEWGKVDESVEKVPETTTVTVTTTVTETKTVTEAPKAEVVSKPEETEISE